jgi:hypothetical protein
MSTRAITTSFRSPTDDALLRCVALANCPNVLGNSLDGEIDWQHLWQKAGEQQVEALVARAIDRDCHRERVPEDVRQSAKTARLRIMLYNMAIHAELNRISALLHAQSIPVVPLKGTNLALRLFDDLGARRCGDIDILVPVEHEVAARELLIADGYVSPERVKPGVRKHAFHGVPLVRQNATTRFVVEMHWTLTDPQFVTIDDKALWKRLLQASLPEESLRPLPPEELLLFLTVHMSKHDHGLLRLLADINQLILREGAAIDWEYLVDLAKRWSTEDMAYFGLSFAAALLGTPVPERVLAQLCPGAWKRQAIYSLAGPGAIMQPPAPDYLRISRFRLAYCLMLRSPLLSLRAYWQYILLPPTDQPQTPLASAVAGIQRPFVGLARTSLAVGTSIRDQRRRADTPSVAGWCQGESAPR